MNMISDNSLCQCGCGQYAGLYKNTDSRDGAISGQPRKFIRGHNAKGACNVNWKGGVWADKSGYVHINQLSGNGTYKLKHVQMAEMALGKQLPPKSVVHHVNSDRHDNRPENLVICDDQSYHMLLHKRTRAYLATGNPESVFCTYCKKWGMAGNDGMAVKTGGQAYHRSCNAANELRRRNKERP